MSLPSLPRPKNDDCISCGEYVAYKYSSNTSYVVWDPEKQEMRRQHGICRDKERQRDESR